MLEVTNLVLPSPEQFRIALIGMRNAYKSWDKSDSATFILESEHHGETEMYNMNGELVTYDEMTEAFNESDKVELSHIPYEQYFMLGQQDLNLLTGLAKQGAPSHRKILRQLPIICDINAPFYWWKQMDTYKVGTTANSESTMHTLTKKAFDMSDFSLEGLDGEYDYIDHGWLGIKLYNFIHSIVTTLNELRSAYLYTQDKKYWYAMIKIMPESYKQKRTWSANYEVLLNIIRDRLGHHLEEWKDFIKYMFNNVPLLFDLTVATGMVKIAYGTVNYMDEKGQWQVFCDVKCIDKGIIAQPELKLELEYWQKR